MVVAQVMNPSDVRHVEAGTMIRPGKVMNMVKRTPSTIVLFVAATVISSQPANAQWWKSVLNAAGQQNQYPQQYAQPYGQQYGQYNQYDQYNQYQQSGGNGNLSQVSDSLRNIERTADQLAKQTMYAPQGSDAAFLLSLNTIKDGSRQARRAADSNNTSDLINRLSQMQVIAGNAATIAQRSGKNSYSLSQIQSMQAGIQQALMMVNSGPIVYGGNNYNPYNPYPNPNPYNSGMLQASGTGRGQFSLMGQALMGIKQASIVCNDPVGRRATVTISQGGQTINLMGTLTSQTPNSATIALNGSDRGVVSGIVNGAISQNGTLMSASGNGMLNGQPFVISFQGN
jgi:hypothetical protein